MNPVNEYKKSALSDAHSLVNDHISLVNRIAGYLKARVPTYMQYDGMVQIGMLGLLSAAGTYDGSTGVEFKDYAKNRIKGAILDEVRKMSDTSRLAIKNTREHSHAIHELANMLERKPTNSDIAEHLNITIDEYEKQRTHADRFKIENIQTDSDEDGDPFDGHVGASENPLTLVEDEQLSELLTNKISQLNDRKKLVMNLYYVEELNLKEIGDVIGVKESRVSQILSSIAQELRDEIAKDTK